MSVFRIVKGRATKWKSLHVIVLSPCPEASIQKMLSAHYFYISLVTKHTYQKT